MKRLMCCLIMLLCAGVLSGAEKKPELKTVENVDMALSMGTWYEIARLPHFFETGLVGVKAEYSLLPNGKIRIINSGYKNDLKGKLKTAQGRAWIADPKTHAKLKAIFFWPFISNYWIVEVGPDYDYAVICESSRKYLWILSRKPVMDDTLYNELLKRIENKGFDISKIKRTPQPER